MVAYYKRIRGTVQHGSLYRLSSPRHSELTANEYVSSDGAQAVLFAFLHSEQFVRPMPAIYLRGLEENARYRIQTIDNKLIRQEGVGSAPAGAELTLSGAYLMHHGLNFALTGDFDSTSVALEKVE